MKTLKLVGLQTFISPFTKLKPIRNGETVTVEDALAERLLEGHEHSRDRGRIDHWMVIPDVAAAQEEVIAAVAEPTEDKLEVAKRAAAAEAHDEEVAKRIAAQAEADKLNPPPPAPAAPEAPHGVAGNPVVPAPAKGQRVARKPASK